MLHFDNNDTEVTIALQFIEPTPEVVDAIEAAGIDIETVGKSYRSTQQYTDSNYIDDAKLADYRFDVQRRALNELGMFAVAQQMEELTAKVREELANDTTDTNEGEKR